MRKVVFALTAAFSILALVTPVLAQDAGVKVKEINFEDDTIEGELQMPNQSNIRAQDDDDLASLIKAREDFVDEMLKSVEDL